jgi:twitching motility protein PilT
MAKLDNLFKLVKEMNGSDLHLVVGEQPKLRLHGKIVDLQGFETFTANSLREWLSEILKEDQLKVFASDRDIDFAYALAGVARFRCNYFVQNSGPAAVFRMIPEKIVALKDLNLPPVLNSFAEYERGLILITGPTGSGKSTTLASIINEINEKYPKHIVTIEDPVEFVHQPKRSLITHREIGAHCTSFESALRAAVREDPDVILVGEMRDLETIKLALTAAEMGFLVLGTLHTNSAAKTIDRIVDVFPETMQSAVRTMLAGSLVAVASQLLVRSIDGNARFCANEILLSSPALANAIRDGNINMIKTIIQAGGARGMQLMDDALDRLCKEGKVDVQDAYAKATEKQRIQKYLYQQKVGAV